MKGKVDHFKEFDIEFKGLSDGVHNFEYSIDNKFFENTEQSLIDDGKVKAKVLLTKKSTFLTLEFMVDGVIEATCDRCLDPASVSIKQEGKIIVKFGEAYDEPSDDVIILPHEDHQINVAQLIYEFIALGLPMQITHKKGKCNPEMVAKLSTLTGSGVESEEQDPRWNELKKLIDIKQIKK